MTKEVSQSDCDAIFDKLDTLSGDMIIVKEALLGKLGAGNPPGLVERVRSLESWREGKVWFERLVVGILITNVAGLVILLLKVVFKL